MKMHPCLVAGALLLALAACRPGAAEYTESEAPKTLTLHNATTHVDVRFRAGSSRLLARDAVRLRALAGSGGIAPSDRVTVATAGAPALAAARFNTIATELLRYQIVASEGPLAGVPPNRAIIETERYLVGLPPCPNWSKPPPLAFANAHASNFGCATATNLGLMVASPADLAEGRPLGLADAIPAVAAVQRYQGDKVALPTGASLGPISGGSAGPTGSGASGAGTAGSAP